MDKYYTPDIEDIRVGYECEVNVGLIPGFRDGWNKGILNQQNISYYLKFGSAKSMFRVSYLAKEQIEAEGWKLVDETIKTIPENYPFLVFVKDNYVLSFVREKKRIEIQKRNEDLQWYIFQGECPSINEFRYICKLLNIE